MCFIAFKNWSGNTRDNSASFHYLDMGANFSCFSTFQIVQRIRVKIAPNVVKASKLVQMKLIT